MDNDLELTREHYDKPVKHGVVPLNDQVFSIYTNSLLHAKNAMYKYQTDVNSTLDSNDINIYSLTSLLHATSLTVSQIEQYLE